MSCISFLLFVTLLAASQPNGAVLLNEESTYGLKEKPSAKSQSSLKRSLQSANVGYPSMAPPRSPSPAAPMTSPSPEPEESTCVEFEMEIALAMYECAKTVIINNCKWSRTCGYIGSELQVDHHHNPKTCCCACQKVNACNALQREFLTGRCIFHCGGRPRFSTDYFSFCWRKQSAIQ